MRFKTFLGLFIAVLSAFCVYVSVCIIRTTESLDWAIIGVISVFGIIAGIGYAIEGTKLGEKIANMFADKEGE